MIYLAILFTAALVITGYEIFECRPQRRKIRELETEVKQLNEAFEVLNRLGDHGVPDPMAAIRFSGLSSQAFKDAMKSLSEALQDMKWRRRSNMSWDYSRKPYFSEEDDE